MHDHPAADSPPLNRQRTAWIIAGLLAIAALCVLGKSLYERLTVVRLRMKYVESYRDRTSSTEFSDYEVSVFAPELIRLHRELSDRQRPWTTQQIVSTPENLGVFNMRNRSWRMLFLLRDRDERILRYMRSRCQAGDLFEDETGDCDDLE